MPEGVEVRKNREFLELFNQSNIQNIELLNNKTKIFEFDLNTILNKDIKNITNIGKFIFFEFTDFYIQIHLNMTGNFTKEKDRFTVLKIETSKGTFFYNDMRTFGKFKKMTLEEYKERKKELGLDILDMKETELKNLTTYIKKNKKKSKIKSVLMDQYIISGIGNIYATEGLFSSKIHPEEIVDNLNELELLSLLKTIKTIMEKSYELGGMSVKHFILSDGKPANGQKNNKIYGKSNCPNDNSILKSTIINGRTSIYCPICQKKKTP